MNLIYRYFRAEDGAGYLVGGQRILKSCASIVETDMERRLVGNPLSSWNFKWGVETGDYVEPMFEFHLFNAEHGEIKNKGWCPG